MPIGALEERDVDLVISLIPTPLADHLQAEVLYAPSRVVVASSENPWSRRRRVGLADLMNEPWTLPPPDSPPGELAAEDFRAAGLDLPRTTLITTTDIARLALVAKGLLLKKVFLTGEPNFAAPLVHATPADLKDHIKATGYCNYIPSERGRKCLLLARLCKGAKQSWRDQSVKVRPR